MLLRLGPSSHKGLKPVHSNFTNLLVILAGILPQSRAAQLLSVLLLGGLSGTFATEARAVIGTSHYNETPTISEAGGKHVYSVASLASPNSQSVWTVTITADSSAVTVSPDEILICKSRVTPRAAAPLMSCSPAAATTG